MNIFNNGKKKDLLEPFRKVKSWWHKKHMAYRDILAYDPVRHRYILNRSTLEQTQITPEDLFIDNERYRYFKTSLELPSEPDTRIEEIDGVEMEFLNPTPISDNLYNESDVLNDACLGEFRNKVLSPMVLAIALGIGVVMVLMFFFMR